MKIENNIEASELCFALAARRSVLRARRQHGKQEVTPEQLQAVKQLFEQAKAVFREYQQPQYRYLAVGETVQEGDEIQRISPYDGTGWAPCRATIGRKVRLTEVGDFRRAV